LGCPAALDHEPVAVLGVLHQVAFPAPGVGDEPLDLLQRDGVLGVQQVAGGYAERFLGRKAVGALCAAVPEGDATLCVACEDRVGCQVQQRYVGRELTWPGFELSLYSCGAILPAPSLQSGVPHPEHLSLVESTTLWVVNAPKGTISDFPE
jgi:hypothetical protein